MTRETSATTGTKNGARPDRPGQLSRLLNIVSSANVNVLDIGHLRHAASVHMGQVEIQLTLETRSLSEKQCSKRYASPVE